MLLLLSCLLILRIYDNTNYLNLRDKKINIIDIIDVLNVRQSKYAQVREEIRYSDHTEKGYNISEINFVNEQLNIWLWSNRNDSLYNRFVGIPGMDKCPTLSCMLLNYSIE